MMNRFLALCTLLHFLGTMLAGGQENPYDPSRLYQPGDLQADLRYLQAQLDSIHPALYRYTPRPAFRQFVDSLASAIDRPLTDQQFLGLLTLLHARIADGHTMLLPAEAALAYNNTQGHFLPFSLAAVNNQLYVTQNYSTDSTIRPGDQVLKINGQGAGYVMDQLLRRQVRDGRNRTYPLWIINHYFAAYYSYAFGQPAMFDLELTQATSQSYHRQVTALTRDSIRHYRQVRYDAPANAGKGIVLSHTLHPATACLSVSTFDSSLLAGVYRQDFKHAFDTVFTQLKQRHVQHLILDLRDNQGGDFEPGRLLLSYLLTRSSPYLTGSGEARTLQPHKDHFSGKLYVLINGGSFSNAAIVSACLEKAGRAFFIGEESGGNKYQISGNATAITLPHTRLQAYISTTNYPISTAANEGHGVLPAYTVQPTIEDLLKGRDPALDRALALIGSQK